MSDNLLIMTLVHCLEKLFVLVLSQMLSRLNLMHFDNLVFNGFISFQMPIIAFVEECLSLNMVKYNYF